jgi:hypothetical protein
MREAMTPEKVKSVLDGYAKVLLELGARPSRNEDPETAIDPDQAKHHLAWMCEETRNLIDEGRIEKAMRWLGFLQGALWALHLRTLEQMKNDNKPADVAYAKERV